jgi:hypothetical protein
MNINPKTGKIWVNNYLQMYGTIFANQNHKYIQMERYYAIIGKLEGRTKAGYAMILHNHCAQITCNRTPGVHSNIFMYIDNGKGSINNSKEMKEWICQTGWMNCNGEHLLDIASNEVWWVVYKAMLDIGLLKAQSGTLRVMIPIEGRFLPIPYAHVAFLSRVKKDSDLSSAIIKALSDIPERIRTNLAELPKEDLIDELVKIRTKNIVPSKSSEVYKMLFEEISAKHPHEWGKNPEKNRENFLEKISENFSEIIPKKNPEKNMENFPEKKSKIKSENNFEKFSDNFPGEKSAEEIIELIPEKISQDITKKKNQKPVGNILPVENIHDFKSKKKSRFKKVSPENESEPLEETLSELPIESIMFFADDTTPNDTKRVVYYNPDSPENNPQNIPENDLEEDFEIDLPNQEYDIFGLPVEYIEEDLEIIPESSIPIGLDPEDMDEFWGG